ncbi:hypothetical protein [Deinococcus sp. Leaf326]|uniref:DUF7352 domain-containing protein n=1 Tax=Deinococcus sp. Leaf326 TaxID=1736338 RepID=UPI0006FA4D93|nr:hypothetical protein [Deinococcus sp. Leaf326]KQR37758.1 hypothetical protein ASF71_14855 [Deinococcus sp. Leaf326]
MPQVMYKYPLTPLDEASVTVLTLPSFALPRMAAMQNGELCLWIQVDPDSAPLERAFEVFGTGQPLPLYATYIATVLNGPFVWHIFEVPRPTA